VSLFNEPARRLRIKERSGQGADNQTAKAPLAAQSLIGQIGSATGTKIGPTASINTESMRRQPMSREVTRVLPVGNYYLGDPQGILSQRHYALLLAATPDSYATTAAALCNVRGHIVAVFRAGHGEGTYLVENASGPRQMLAITSGNIALVPEALGEAEEAVHNACLIRACASLQAKLGERGLRVSGTFCPGDRAISPLIVSFTGRPAG
jgi:hypothetical protein